MSRGVTGRTAWGLGRVAFLANMEKVRDEVSQGWPLSQIYERYQKSLGGMSYAQFTHHVRKHIRTGNPRAVDKPATTNVEKKEILKPKGLDIEAKKFKPSPKVPDPADLF